MKRFILYMIGICMTISSCNRQQHADWPEITPDARAGIRWWWMGNAVDSAGLTANLEDLHDAGFGTVEITPIYGVNGAEEREIEYLTPQWMKMYGHVVDEGRRLGMCIDMNNGTGWPFGGPNIDMDYAATRVIFQQYALKGGTQFRRRIIPDDPQQRDVATIAAIMAYGNGRKIDLMNEVSADLMIDWTVPDGDWTVWVAFNGKTLQRVKRSAPGGEGLVMNHYSHHVVDFYLNRFDRAFLDAGASWPRSFFNDSYEVGNASWSENLLNEFEQRRGYRLQEYLPELNRVGNPDSCARIICDYRQTIGELLLDEFTVPWTKWAHQRGVSIRNQAHGSPGNLIDFYAAVDIPECESFGWTNFDIPGLRNDSAVKLSDAHLPAIKFASSAAHITGKRHTSAETFTWLTEHFRTSLSQMKPELDRLFASGVNQVVYHGSPYSPPDAKWPGWLFYASLNLNRNNTVFRDIRGLNDYITRSQSFLQDGQPDNDFLLYFPVWDFWQKQPGLYLPFTIHHMKQQMPDFFNTVEEIHRLGFSADYISDKYLLETRVKKKMIQTQGAAYQAIIVPDAEFIPAQTLLHLLSLAREGATVIFIGRIPDKHPGFYKYTEYQATIKAALQETQWPFPPVASLEIGNGRVIYGMDNEKILQATGVKSEELTTMHGAHLVRRNHSEGHIYFVAMLQNRPLDGWVKLAAKNIRTAIIFNPLTEESGMAQLRKNNGDTEIYLQLEPGESLIIKTFTGKQAHLPDYNFYRAGTPQIVKADWTFRFTDGQPRINDEFSMKEHPVFWTDLPHDSTAVYAGTGSYTAEFELTDEADEWLLNISNLRESARVRINGKNAGIVWSLPFALKIGKYLQQGKNVLQIDVTNLPANRIHDFDKRGVQWRIFKDINIVNVFYKKELYDHWDIMPSGLASPVSITPLFRQEDPSKRTHSK